MSWARIERYAHELVAPRWLQAWRVRAARSHPVSEHERHDHPRRLFVDLGVISRHDAGTGIQRTARAVAHQLLSAPPAGWEVIPVAATRKRPYHPIAWPHRSTGGPLQQIEGCPGDVFLGLDFSLDTVRHHSACLADFRRRGGKLWFVVYDLLPALHPEWFSDKLVVRYRKWLAVLAAQADGFYCISPPVEAELRRELASTYGLLHGFETRVLPMGADLGASRPSKGVPDSFTSFLQGLRPHRVALMVGTLEPRKGHADVLDAFELLWESGSQDRLVIVGKPGWKTDKLQARLNSHPLLGKQLFWLQDVSDEALSMLYDACHGLVAASFAEGFGLPVVEALTHGKAVLARALPVFELHAEHGVTYFPAAPDTRELASCLQRWLDAQDTAPATDRPMMPSWSDTARAIMAALEPAR